MELSLARAADSFLARGPGRQALLHGLLEAQHFVRRVLALQISRDSDRCREASIRQMPASAGQRAAVTEHLFGNASRPWLPVPVASRALLGESVCRDTEYLWPKKRGMEPPQTHHSEGNQRCSPELNARELALMQMQRADSLT